MKRLKIIQTTTRMTLLATAVLALSGVVYAADNTPIKIGVLTELTGPFASVGVYLRRTVEAYTKAANARGGLDGHPIELVVIDTQSKVELAVAGMRKLANDDQVHAVVCCSTSPISLAVKPVSKQLKIPVIATGTAADVVSPPDQAQWIFRPNLGQETGLRIQLQSLKSAGIKNVAFLGVNNAFGTFPAKLMETLAPEYGITTTGTQFFEVTATDVKSQLALLQATKPDAIIVWAVGPAATLISKNAQELAMKTKVYHSMGAANAEFIRDGGTAVEGNFVSGTLAMVPIQALPKNNPAYNPVKEYNDAWMAAFNTTGDEFGRTLWDGMNLISLAVKAKKPDLTKVEESRAAIRDGIEGVRNYVGIGGTFNMTPEDHSGLGNKGGAMLQIKDGKFVLVQ